ncbi:MAG TPA: Gfo/Idh/MocA family oxidoreductase [Planctomycetaceae bacterium]
MLFRNDTRRVRPSMRVAAIALLALCGSAVFAYAQAPSGAVQNRQKKAPGKAPGKAAGKTPGAMVQPKTVFAKFPDWVACVAFSPDGNTLAAGSYGVAKLLDVANQQQIAELNEPAGFVKAVAFSPDGKTLAVGSYQSLSLWDVAEKKLVHPLKGHRGYVTSVAFSPDGKTLASGSEDETVRLWDATSGELRSSIKGMMQPVLAVAFSHDGRRIAVATGDATRPTKKGAARVYDIQGNLLLMLEGHDRVVSAVAFSPDDLSLATGSADESIKLWDLSSGKELRTFEGHSRPVNSLAFTADGKLLFSVCGGRALGGNELKLWDVVSGKDIATVPAHESPINQLALSADNKYLATASLDKTAKVWAVSTILAAAGLAKEKPADAESDFHPESPALPEPALSESVASSRIDDTNPKRERGSPATSSLARRVSMKPIALTRAKDEEKATEAKLIRIGIIGLDTSHSIAFTQIINKPGDKDKERVAGFRIVAAYPKGSPDIKSSTERVPEYTQKVKDLDVEIVDSIEDLVTKVDAVMLETNDGRPHLEQVLPVLKAGKPVFIDKPIAGSLADAVAIFEAAKKYKAPVFSSSSLRYTTGAQEIRGGKIGEVKGCDTYSPCALESTHPDLFWYGIHGVESLFTVMGTGCESVTRISTPGIDLAAGVWKGGRVGTFRGIRTGEDGGKADYGGTAFGTSGIQQIGTYGGYAPLVFEILKFFRTGKVPVTEEETLEIYAFMEAADESKRQGGKPVTIESVMAKARAEAAKKAN